MATYVAQLRQLTQYCEFGDSLEEMLRDHVVCGIADVRMQRVLLAEPQLTFMKALQMIQTMETADRDSRELQAQTTSPVPVNTVSRVARFLSRYRTTPQSTTGTTPAELMFGRKLRTRLDLLKPDLEVAVHRKQTKQKAAHDYHATDCSFKEGAYVYVYNQAGSLSGFQALSSRKQVLPRTWYN